MAKGSNKYILSNYSTELMSRYKRHTDMYELFSNSKQNSFSPNQTMIKILLPGMSVLN